MQGGGARLSAGIHLLIGLIVVGVIAIIVFLIIGVTVGWDSPTFIYGIIISGFITIGASLWLAYRTRD